MRFYTDINMVDQLPPQLVAVLTITLQYCNQQDNTSLIMISEFIINCKKLYYSFDHTLTLAANKQCQDYSIG